MISCFMKSHVSYYIIIVVLIIYIVNIAPKGDMPLFVEVTRKLDSSAPPLPYLEEDPRLTVGPKPRYVANGRGEQLVAIYTWWNLLDRLMEHNYLSPGGGMNYGAKWTYGYVRRFQMEQYTRHLVKENGAKRKRYCEIGVNGGHGTVAMLLSDPELDVVSFDLGAYKYSRKVYNLLKTAFPGRIKFHIGSSYDEGGVKGTVPIFADSVRMGREKPCDLILIDGAHTLDGAYKDILNMKEVASCDNVVLFDDINERSGGAFEKAVKNGILTVIDRFHGGHKNKEINPCLRWVGQPTCYNSTDSTLIENSCTKCLKEFSFATARITNPSQGCE
jgi:hypothetical protein